MMPFMQVLFKSQFMQFVDLHVYSTYMYVLTCICVLSHAKLFGTPRTVVHQAPLPIEFSKHKYQSGLPFPALGHLPGSRIQSTSLASPALAGSFFMTVPPAKPHKLYQTRTCIVESSQIWRRKQHREKDANTGDGGYICVFVFSLHFSDFLTGKIVNV